MRNKFQYESIDTLNYIAFHDCIISKAEWEKENLLIYFEWLDILKMHPLNTTGKAKNANNAMIFFENTKIIKSVVYDMARVYEEGKKIGRKRYNLSEADIVPTPITTLCEDFEIYSDELEIVDNKFQWNVSSNNQFIIEFDHAVVYFNDLEEDAWFENWLDKSPEK